MPTKKKKPEGIPLTEASRQLQEARQRAAERRDELLNEARQRASAAADIDQARARLEEEAIRRRNRRTGSSHSDGEDDGIGEDQAQANADRTSVTVFDRAGIAIASHVAAGIAEFATQSIQAASEQQAQTARVSTLLASQISTVIRPSGYGRLLEWVEVRRDGSMMSVSAKLEGLQVENGISPSRLRELVERDMSMRGRTTLTATITDLMRNQAVMPAARSFRIDNQGVHDIRRPGNTTAQAASQPLEGGRLVGIMKKKEPTFEEIRQTFLDQWRVACEMAWRAGRELPPRPDWVDDLKPARKPKKKKPKPPTRWQLVDW